MCKRLIELNREMIVEYQCDLDGHFLQLFVALEVSIHEFNMGCRPIIVIESWHMSRPYKEVMFSASNADDSLFPLAYGLFTSENFEDWIWFLQKLKLAISQRKVVIISDRHQGIVRSISKVFGSKFYAHCYLHIKENFRSIFTKINTRGRKGKKNALETPNKVVYAQREIEYDIALETL